MARGLKITNTDSSGQIHDRYTSQQYINGAYIGGTGGDTGQVGRQISARAKIGSNAEAAAFIIAQKGRKEFRVQDASVNKGSCALVNLATPTAANTMSIRVDLLAITSANIAAANVAGGATSTYVTFASANVAGPVAVATNNLLLGFAGNASSATVTAINATVGGLANVTVSISGNVAAQTVNITDTVYASRITNKFVHDFGNDGYGNPNKYRYHLASPDTTFVQVAYL